MNTIIIPLFLGGAFILLGRWIYAKPKSVFPSWLYADPESPRVKLGARIFATLLIFVGSYAVAVLSAGLLFQRPVLVVALGLAIAIVGTWFLRPRAADRSG